MIKKIENDDNNIIEKYINDEYYKCIYLYLDYKKYGFNNNNVNIWIQTNDLDITAIILMYYTGMHIYSKKNNYNIEEIKELILNNKPTMICAEQSIIEELYSVMDKEKYNMEKGWVRELSKCNNYSTDNVELANKEDFFEIANLLYNDEDLGCSYKLNELANQLYERNKEGFVRNYVIKQDNKVISHAATGAENDKIAMLAYVITDPNYRGKGYALKVCSKICNDLINEGKKIYLINYSNESTALYDKIGFKICCKWGKLFIDLKK